jgi:diguanylate cyclase (GGDEF)-like protein/PAS domain S-box-containing protein
MLDIWGYSSIEELEAVPRKQRYTPQTYAEHLERLEKRKRGEPAPLSYETSIVRSDGEPRILSVSRGELLWNGEKRFQIVSQDITEYRQLEEALTKSEERYRTVLEQMEEAYYETDIAGNFTFFNDAMCRQLGYSREELMGMSFKVLTPPEDVKRIFGLYNQVYRTGEPFTSVPIERIRKDGTRISVESSIFPLRNESGEITGFRGLAGDVTERRQFEQKLAEMATHDALTGLPNRALLSDRFTVALELSRRTGNRLAVMMLDLDRFKAVNDSMGHGVGDRLLKAVGKRLKVIMRKSDTVARIGGDEFVVLLPQIPHADEVAKFAQRILDAFREPFVFNGYRPHVTTSIGIAVYPEGGKDIEGLLKNADTAMYRAKEQGRDTYRFWDANEAAALLAERRAVCA